MITADPPTAFQYRYAAELIDRLTESVDRLRREPQSATVRQDHRTIRQDAVRAVAYGLLADPRPF